MFYMFATVHTARYVSIYNSRMVVRMNGIVVVRERKFVVSWFYVRLCELCGIAKPESSPAYKTMIYLIQMKYRYPVGSLTTSILTFGHRTF